LSALRTVAADEGDTYAFHFDDTKGREGGLAARDIHQIGGQEWHARQLFLAAQLDHAAIQFVVPDRVGGQAQVLEQRQRRFVVRERGGQGAGADQVAGRHEQRIRHPRCAAAPAAPTAPPRRPRIAVARRRRRRTVLAAGCRGNRSVRRRAVRAALQQPARRRLPAQRTGIGRKFASANGSR
jgi:hypothetical protein